VSNIRRIARRKELQEAIDAWVERHQRPNNFTEPMLAVSPRATS
jgi:hypothetical protein